MHAALLVVPMASIFDTLSGLRRRTEGAAVVDMNGNAVAPYDQHEGPGCAYIDKDTESSWAKGFTFNVRVPEWTEGRVVVIHTSERLGVSRVWNSKLLEHTDLEVTIELAKYPGGDEDAASEHHNEFGVMGTGPMPDLVFSCPGPPAPPSPPPSPSPPAPSPPPPPPSPPPPSPSPPPPPLPLPPQPLPPVPDNSTLAPREVPVSVGKTASSDDGVSSAVLTAAAMMAFALLAAIAGYFLAKKLLFTKSRKVQTAADNDEEDDDGDGDGDDGCDDSTVISDQREDPDEFAARSAVRRMPPALMPPRS